jgi:hypothetical protein
VISFRPTRRRARPLLLDTRPRPPAQEPADTGATESPSGERDQRQCRTPGLAPYRRVRLVNVPPATAAERDVGYPEAGLAIFGVYAR